MRDSGLVHALLGIAHREQLLGHPVAGASWEGLAIDSLVPAAGTGVAAHHYRTTGGAEVDLVLEWPGAGRWLVEIKRTLTPKVTRGLRSVIVDLEPEHTFVVYAGRERFPLGDGVDAIGLRDLCRLLSDPGTPGTPPVP